MYMNKSCDYGLHVELISGIVLPRSSRFGILPLPTIKHQLRPANIRCMSRNTITAHASGSPGLQIPNAFHIL